MNLTATSAPILLVQMMLQSTSAPLYSDSNIKFAEPHDSMTSQAMFVYTQSLSWQSNWGVHNQRFLLEPLVKSFVISEPGFC